MTDMDDDNDGDCAGISESNDNLLYNSDNLQPEKIYKKK